MAGFLIYQAASRKQNGAAIGLLNYVHDFSRLAKIPLTSIARSSWSEAREKLSYQAMEFLLEQVKAPMLSRRQRRRFLYKGHRVIAIDGTKLGLPRSEDILKEFPTRMNNGQEEHYPLGIMLTAVDALTGQPLYASLGNKHSSENSQLEEMLKKLPKESIVLLDRGFPSFCLFKKMSEENLNFICRVKADGRCPNYVREFLASGQTDAIRTIRDSQGNTQKIRLVRGPKTKQGFLVIVSSLLDEAYAKQEILDLYKKRWQSETNYYQVKSLLNLQSFHSRKLNGVKQELYANLIVLALGAVAMVEAASDGLRRLSCKNVVETIKLYIAFYVGIGLEAQDLVLQQIRERIRSVYHHHKPNRHYPRYSRRPVNRWAYAKANKIQQYKKTGRVAA